jgi:hypothetical protein
VCAAVLPRSAAQRRADAFTAIFQTAARVGIGGEPLDVVVNLLMDVDQFEQHLAEAVADTPVVVDPATVRSRRCETADGLPVDPRQVVALAFVGQVRRIVVDGAGVVINAGRRRRLYTGPIRDALIALEPRCSWLGCMIRAAISEIDHIRSYADGGGTDAGNAAITCEHHNLFKYRRNYATERAGDGTWTLTRPDGTNVGPPDAA